MGKWEALILWHVREEKKRYGELRKLLNEIKGSPDAFFYVISRNILIDEIG
jgi:DNA-binding HxlR family transcriptional regulator